ncbi:MULTISPECIES: glycosyltransferase family 2 protein [unclassified Marinimicrobium]|jgi:cellulose synthase/poly-beta-1,6-N-acetylglucosamine synthase-like glycosyltransferase|uniref:glycosyltransferase family 2 protein n=1 Tax=unclassified Marinimicrobium TaxID=2632100 RepID=UPI000C409692|nr:MULTISPECIES: glycosyltransferase family 2 protein [unclassified Marinimicrobium]MAN51409.1 glycosyl transferase [Marinimicrobium sp.]|tara:strand:+ start:462 stop:1601 length:1140 start_codon:yes stop_codon:yes gene_type:complete
MQALFWFSAILIGYIYLGYPLLLRLLPKRPLAYGDEPMPAPLVTVLIPAFNEAEVIESTIRNKLAQAYPEDRLDIIVISDESEDGTDEIVTRLAEEDARISLIRQTPRQGKTAGLNKAVAQAKGDIIIFSDANSHYEQNAISALVNCFSDPEVGYVTGKMVYVNEEGNLVGDGCSAYMRYENNLRALETQVSSVVGVDGGIDAIRKELYQEMSPDQLPDFVQPLKVVSQGKRVVYCEDALLQEESLTDSGSEFRMRVRVSLRAYWAMWDMKHLFNPMNYGLFSLQIISHKLLRYLAFIPLVSALLASLVLADYHWFFALAALGQLVFYVAAGYAQADGKTDSRLLGLVHYFSLINLASMMAFFKFVKGEKIVMWKPRGG